MKTEIILRYNQNHGSQRNLSKAKTILCLHTCASNRKAEHSFSTTTTTTAAQKTLGKKIHSATHFTSAGHTNFHILVKDPLHTHSFSILPHFEKVSFRKQASKKHLTTVRPHD